MIRINLVRQRRARRQTSDQPKSVPIGIAGLLAAAAAVFFLVHSPMASDLEELQKKNKRRKKDNKDLKVQVDKLKDVDKISKALEVQANAIEFLNNARATPANLLHELSQILTLKGNPTMTDEMKSRVAIDKNRTWSRDWDPKHVWINRFSEKNGTFKLEGGAQTDRDINELAFRLQASVYFDQVQPVASSQASALRGGVNYYKFTIKGKVKY